MHTDPYVQGMMPLYLRAFNVQMLKTGQSYRPTHILSPQVVLGIRTVLRQPSRRLNANTAEMLIQCDLTERSASHREATGSMSGLSMRDVVGKVTLGLFPSLYVHFPLKVS